MANYDAILVVSFGGPEGRDDVIPFLENVLRGKPVPRERMLEVAEHYYQFEGVSPINAQNRKLIEALEAELQSAGLDLPVYYGCRNWHPLLPDTLGKMKDNGVKKALAIFTSAFSSYSGCRQYWENLADARQQVGEGAPEIDKIRTLFNHPGFVGAVVERLRESLAQLATPDNAEVVFTAHSIPNAMADGCDYVQQLQSTCGEVCRQLGHERWRLVYQSRSGAPHIPWLEPDVCDYIEERHAGGDLSELVICPIGFVSDHMEVMFDLDTEARELCERLGLNMVRAGTVGTHPAFISGLRDLIEEKISNRQERPACGDLPPAPDRCPEGCCPSGRPARPAT